MAWGARMSGDGEISMNSLLLERDSRLNVSGFLGAPDLDELINYDPLQRPRDSCTSSWLAHHPRARDDREVAQRAQLDTAAG